VDELEEQYGGQIDFIRFEVTTEEGNCEYQRQQFPEGKVPAMVYIDRNGNKVEMTETLLTKDQLEPKLQNLLSIP
jgi:hypothetical protein